MPLSEPHLILGLIVAILLWTTYGVLGTIGHQYEQAVEWHNLKVRAHQLRLQQQRRLIALMRQGADLGQPPKPLRGAGASTATGQSPASPGPAQGAAGAEEVVAEAIPVDELEAVITPPDGVELGEAA